MRIKIQQTSTDVFFESNFVGVKKLFALIYPNQNDSVKRFNGKKYYLAKGVIKNYIVITN